MAYAAAQVRSPSCLPIASINGSKPRAFGTVLRTTLERDAVCAEWYAFEQKAQVGQKLLWPASVLPVRQAHVAGMAMDIRRTRPDPRRSGRTRSVLQTTERTW